MIYIVVVIISSLLLIGCASRGMSNLALREQKIQAHLRLESIRQAVEDGRIRPGMKDKELIALIGRPDNIVKIQTDHHIDEQWIYEDRIEPRVKYFSFHFQDGSLIEW